MKALSCPPELWSEFSRLLDEALDLPEPLRAGWLAQLPARHAAVLPWLRRVLENPAGPLTADYLQAPQLPLAASSSESDFAAGQRIGPWQLVSELGRGGMGVVWRARRIDGVLQREAALKLPHAHLLAGALRERFDRERDILAALNHPHIAALYDAGLAEGGQPWLALELVEGVPISDWCRARRLGLDARLDLFAQVLAAVQYAHARLVVHRDLKPSNVLVDGGGQVKLLDFGIAKLLDGESGGAATALTQLGGRAATPDYAAPEQLAGGAVTTATDVHALGAMLYELLCGQRPHARAGRARLSLTDAADGEAPLASSRVEPGQAESLGLTASVLRRGLRGDLDAILAKALSPAPEQRYATVEAFAADLDRARRHEPIVARRIGRLQLAGKFLRRHRLGAGFGAALLLAIAVGLAGVLWQAREARQQARRAEAVKDFLIGVFKASDPRIASDKPRGQITARELLDVSTGRIDRRFADDPEVRIELLRTAADIYRELGEQAAYEALQARQLELVRQHYGPHHPNVLDAAVEAGVQACGRADAPRCAAAQAAADALLKAAGDTDPERRGHWWINEGLRLQADPQQREATLAAYQQAVALFAAQAPESRGHVTALLELGSIQQAQMQLAEGIATYRRAIALAESLPERNDAEMQTLWSNLGITHQQAGQLAEAGAAFGRSADYAERTTGADSPTAWVARGQAARTLHLAGERDAAWREYARLIPLLPPLAALDRDLATLRLNYGDRLSAEGRAAEAIPQLEAVARYFATQKVYEHQGRLARRFLGEAYTRAGQRAEARRELQASLAEYLAHGADGDQPVMAIRESWGRLLLDEGSTAAAQAQFGAVVKAAGGRKLAHIALAHGGLARAALAVGDREAAARESAAALAIWGEVTGFRDVRMGPYLQRIRADVLAASGDLAGAQALEDAAAEASARYDAPESATRNRRVMRAR